MARENFIKRLQSQVATLDNQRETALQSVEAMLQHLHSPKFTSFEGGARKDWIATGDVIAWLREMRLTLLDEHTRHF